MDTDMPTAPDVNVSFPVGDTSIIVLDGDDFRSWLRWQHETAGLLPYPQVKTAREILARIARLLGVDDYNG